MKFMGKTSLYLIAISFSFLACNNPPDKSAANNKKAATVVAPNTPATTNVQTPVVDNPNLPVVSEELKPYYVPNTAFQSNQAATYAQRAAAQSSFDYQITVENQVQQFDSKSIEQALLDSISQSFKNPIPANYKGPESDQVNQLYLNGDGSITVDKPRLFINGQSLPVLADEKSLIGIAGAPSAYNSVCALFGLGDLKSGLARYREVMPTQAVAVSTDAGAQNASTTVVNNGTKILSDISCSLAVIDEQDPDAAAPALTTKNDDSVYLPATQFQTLIKDVAAEKMFRAQTVAKKDDGENSIDSVQAPSFLFKGELIPVTAASKDALSQLYKLRDTANPATYSQLSGDDSYVPVASLSFNQAGAMDVSVQYVKLSENTAILATLDGTR